MADKTGISWVTKLYPDGHREAGSTWNPWIGCTAVSPGCAHCYADRENDLYHWVEKWGKGQGRHHTSADYWKKPLAWARSAVKHGIKHQIFCASLSDILDNEVVPAWKNDLWALIDETLEINATGAPGTGVEWLLLTKRPENIGQMPIHWRANPPEGIRLGVSVENQDYEPRLSTLLNLWQGHNFVSVEPLLGAVDLGEALNGYPVQVGAASFVTHEMALDAGEPSMEGMQLDEDRWQPTTPALEWVIIGGESGPDARPTHPKWVYDLIEQSRRANARVFVKQWGEWLPNTENHGLVMQDDTPWGSLEYGGRFIKLDGWGGFPGTDPADDYKVSVYRVGRERAGNLVGGVEIHEFPV